MLRYYRKNKFVKIVWPADSTQFIYVTTHCVETVNKLDYNRYFQLTRWSKSNAFALGVRGPGFNPGSNKDIYV